MSSMSSMYALTELDDGTEARKGGTDGEAGKANLGDGGLSREWCGWA